MLRTQPAKGDCVSHADFKVSKTQMLPTTAGPPAATVFAGLVDGVLVDGLVGAAAVAGGVPVGNAVRVNLAHPDLDVGVVCSILDRLVQSWVVGHDDLRCCC